MSTATRQYKTLLNPKESVLCLIDHQPQMFFGVQSTDRQLLLNNVVALAKTAKTFDVPTVLTTITPDSFAGDLPAEVVDLFPGNEVIVRTNVNSWEHDEFRDAVLATGRRQILMAGLWSEVCLALPALSALEEGHEVFVVVDASAGAGEEAHRYGIQRVVSAGGVPVTWQQVLSEFMRDWSRTDVYDAATTVVKEHGGAWGQGIRFVGQGFAKTPALAG